MVVWSDTYFIEIASITYLGVGFETLKSRSCELNSRELTVLCRTGGMIRLETLTELKCRKRSFLSLSSYHIGIGQAVPCRAVRGSSISAKSTPSPLFRERPRSKGAIRADFASRFLLHSKSLEQGPPRSLQLDSGSYLSASVL